MRLKFPLLTAAVLLTACTINVSVHKEIVVGSVAKVKNVGESALTKVVALPGQYAEGLTTGTVCVQTEDGKNVDAQIGRDGELLVYVNLAAGESKELRIKRGVNLTDTVCTGKVYPYRVDDIAWESDQIAYRGYGKAFGLKGWKAYGFDVMVKNVKTPVLEKRFWTMFNPETLQRIEELKKTDKKAARELENNVSYHIDHGEGMDCYAVGETLGAGATALLDSDGKMVYQNCWESCEIKENGPIRFSVLLKYKPVEVDGNLVEEERLIEISKGESLNKTTVRYKGLVRPTTVVAGAVIHSAGDLQELVMIGSDYVAYNDPTEGDPKKNGTIYVGLKFAEGVDSTALRMFDSVEQKRKRGAFGHVVGYKTLSPDKAEMTYYWGANWSKNYTFDSYQKWVDYLKKYETGQQLTIR